MSHAASINSLLQADFAVQRLLQSLTDLELTNLASTCQAWKQAVSSSLTPWLKDVSEGLERRPIPCKVSAPVTSLRRLQCGPACACSLKCPLKVTQQGLAIQLQLVSSCKGWSAVTCQDIAKGAFVAQYAGEVISNKEAESRLEAYDAHMQTIGHALLIVRETLPSGNACLRMNIDATRMGNVARFFNHSCDGGNMSLEVVRSRGNLLPHVALFANRQIKQGEELTFSYGPSRSELSLPVQSDTAIEIDSTARRRRPCLCGTAACLGFLPGA